MVSMTSPLAVIEAQTIPYVNADEAYSLMKVQLDRMLALLETLAPEDWSKPTACTLWNVRDMIAHQAGGYASGTGYGEMIHQYRNSILPRRDKLPEDIVNEQQIAERAGRSPAELITELRAVGPVAIHKWAYDFRLAKLAAIPHAIAGILTLRHLMWVIHSRDTWMHRLDICRATGRPFEQTAGQDGRIAALVMRDVAKALRGKLGGKSLLFQLTGVAGGCWKVGAGEPSATIQMDVLDFNIFVSGRFTYEEARKRLEISGDVPLAENALKNLIILY
jgi:uncharacterized protein (TIGR03083 family)